jgi:predicted N-acyltransferase
MDLDVRSSLATVEPAAWDALVGAGSPFLEWGWLAALEDAGCVGPATGWLAQHLTLWEHGRLVGACPLYVKGHSEGEFVFDYGWAEAAAAAGIRYYPKLLVAVPFTPVPGARLLAHPDADRPAVVRALGEALVGICRRQGFSSVHVNFCLPDEVALLAALGYERRTGYQFHWENAGWHTFDDYLAALRSKRRTQVRREARALATHGIEITVHSGDEIADALFEPMFRLYRTTTDKFVWGRPYLNAGFFDLLRRRWKRRLCFVAARRAGTLLAGAVNVRKGSTLYGRYWGTFEEVPYLHFNVCYYAAIAHCLREGITRFEAGAGGDFKHLRGFEPRPTDSMHFVADPRLARAVGDYLRRERRAMADQIDWLGGQGAFKRCATPR